MAELPLQNPTDNPLVPGSNFVRGALGMPIVRQIGLLLAISASVAIAVFAILWIRDPEMRPVSGALNAGDTADVISALEGSDINFELDARNGLVLVPVQGYFGDGSVSPAGDLLRGSRRRRHLARW